MNILFIAPFKNFTAKDGGYGNASLSYINVLNDLKDKNIISSIDTINTLEFNNFQFDSNKKYDIALVITHPSTFNNPQMVAKFNAILSNVKEKYLHVLWETCPLPKAWKFLWGNDSLFTGFFAASYFLVYQLQQVTDKPIYYVPYYIQIPDESINIDEKEKEDVFSVLLIGQDTIRKGLEDGIIAFNRAFNTVENVQLIIKYHNLDLDKSSSFEEKIIKISQSNSSCQKNHIYIINNELSNNEVYDLYRNSSVLLMPSRGEGFCLPIAESMSVGLPCIYTNWSAMSEVGESLYNQPVSFHLDESVSMFSYGYEIGSVYAYPSILSIMKNLFKMYSLWNKDKITYYKNSANNIKLINERYNKTVVSYCLMNLFEKGKNISPNINHEFIEKNEQEYEHIIKMYKD